MNHTKCRRSTNWSSERKFSSVELCIQPMLNDCIAFSLTTAVSRPTGLQCIYWWIYSICAIRMTIMLLSILLFVQPTLCRRHSNANSSLYRSVAVGTELHQVMGLRKSEVKASKCTIVQCQGWRALATMEPLASTDNYKRRLMWILF